jgi:hypothetical protein
MNILLDQNNVAFFIGMTFTVTNTNVEFSDGSVCNDLNTSNTYVINTDPPQVPLSGAWKWENNAWACINQDAVDSYIAQQKSEFNAVQKAKREDAYRIESDPIYFLSQRGEATVQEWEAKITEIKARYPYQQ